MGAMISGGKNRTMPHLFACAAAAVVLWPAVAVAQAEQQAAPVESDEIARLKADAAQKEAEIAQLKKDDEEIKERVEELSKEIETSQGEEDDLSELESSPAIEHSLEIYGFFDVEFYYLDSHDVKGADGILPNKLTFMVNRLNLYFLARMTETLSALAEIRFTFLPNGYESSYAEPTYLGTEYERTDTTVSDPFNSEESQLGGIVIERVHLTWMPFEFLGVVAGRYLTPFGIWNVDHGSPVVVPINSPFFMVRQVVPLAQTGLEVLGRIIPRPRFYIDYAITLSNGRGPTQTFYDLDNNKALGGRLKLSYEGTNTKVAIGGYIFWGQTTDVKKTLRYDAENIDDFTIWIDVEDTEKYTETVGTADFYLETFNVILQSEFMTGQVRYDVRPVFSFPVINVADPRGGLQPDYNKWGIYGFLGYRILFSAKGTDMSLTPFAMTEYYVFSDVFDDYTALTIRGGLNFKPSAFITLKLEVERSTFPQSKTNTGALWLYASQVAVSF
jgi:hypothetical protein